MKEFVINDLEQGQRFDKYLTKRLPLAGKSFIYKMLRKKNITLNGKKADGSEKIKNGDVIKIFFTDETFEKFAGKNSDSDINDNSMKMINKTAFQKLNIEVLFEDDNYIFFNKPVGVLSQRADKNDYSLVEYLRDYLLNTGFLTNKELETFKPGICNRLDRNTSGIVAAGKTVTGLQKLTEYFHLRTIHKYYICIVKGKITTRNHIKGYLLKNEKTNKVKIYKENDSYIPKEALKIETEYIPMCSNENITLLKVNLITGRSHQIRAHLASIGHSILGDVKYGSKYYFYNDNKKNELNFQLLHAYQLEISQDKLIITTKIPLLFEEVLKGENLWQHGIQEDLEALH